MKIHMQSYSAETLAVMIRQLLPETLKYLHEVNTESSREEYTLWSRSQVRGLTETQCFLGLLSAVLERNSPKDAVVGMSSRSTACSHSSRASSTMESRASSAMLTHRYVCLCVRTLYVAVTGRKRTLAHLMIYKYPLTRTSQLPCVTPPLVIIITSSGCLK